MIGTAGASSLYAVGAKQVSGGVKPDSFKPQTSTLSGSAPFNSGLSLAFQKLTDLQFEVLLHLLYQVLEKRQRNKITNLHVPPSLAHHPDGGPLDGLAAEGAEHQRVRGGALFLSLRERRG